MFYLLDHPFQDIPHFKQVIIMATVCSSCGYRSNEVKSGTGVSPKGTKITLRLTDLSDLSRDILKVQSLCDLLERGFMLILIINVCH